MRIRDAAQLLDMRPDTLRSWVRQGKLRGVNLSYVLGADPHARDSVRVLAEDVQRLIQAVRESGDGI